MTDCSHSIGIDAVREMTMTRVVNCKFAWLRGLPLLPHSLISLRGCAQIMSFLNATGLILKKRQLIRTHFEGVLAFLTKIEVTCFASRLSSAQFISIAGPWVGRQNRSKKWTVRLLVTQNAAEKLQVRAWDYASVYPGHPSVAPETIHRMFGVSKRSS